jgi:hypothetical protein
LIHVPTFISIPTYYLLTYLHACLPTYVPTYLLTSKQFINNPKPIFHLPSTWSSRGNFKFGPIMMLELNGNLEFLEILILFSKTYLGSSLLNLVNQVSKLINNLPIYTLPTYLTTPTHLPPYL